MPKDHLFDKNVEAGFVLRRLLPLLGDKGL
jgi:hypothetical protein